MILKNPFNFINQFFKNIKKQTKTIYLNSNYYDKKISRIKFDNLVYKPSPHLLSSIIKYQKKNLILIIFLIKTYGIMKILKKRTLKD